MSRRLDLHEVDPVAEAVPEVLGRAGEISVQPATIACAPWRASVLASATRSAVIAERWRHGAMGIALLWGATLRAA